LDDTPGVELAARLGGEVSGTIASQLIVVRDPQREAIARPFHIEDVPRTNGNLQRCSINRLATVR
jgi:hypothetical protein